MEWTRGSMIGRGSTATVSVAMDVPSGELFAVKSTELSHSKLLQKEQNLLSKLSSPFIVKYRGFDIRNECNQPIYNLFMEYIPQGTLYDDIQRHGGRLEESLIRTYTRQILQGLEYLHGNGLIHCDIKSHNILMGKKNVKIADLGCARLVERVPGNGDFGTVTFCGTPVFMAPEVLRGEEQGFEADLWALGCTIIEMATGKGPWLDVDNLVSALHRIGFSDDVPEFPSWLSKKAKDFLGMCLSREPKQRMTARELLEHPFLEEKDSQSDQVVNEFFMNSPNSVLESLWDSFEVNGSPQNPNHKGSSSDSNSNSAAARIEELINGATMDPSVSNEANWTWSEDWIEVRSNNDEANNEFSDKMEVVLPTNEPPLACSLPDCSSINIEEELGRLGFDEDFLFKFSFGHVKIVRTERGFVITFEITENTIVFRNKNFMTQEMKIFLFFNMFFGLLFEAYKLLFVFSFIFVFLPNHVDFLSPIRSFSCCVNILGQRR
ncbi:mitogen-activated protein kinase kinase kinase 18-like [Ziziphus jujuba]|uniref:Mitogen-activated protein kinase kinase kinase 18-like n=1 Tax=Ziziphus jujuba TaxID=326968 RepID=A0A6P3Z597_ZIZJJ|nr:mitogen-activated protein kinase kinase kinase 18-like [Ziziphus jujuba]